MKRAQEEFSQTDPSLADQALVNRDSPAAPPTNGLCACKETGGAQPSLANRVRVPVALLWPFPPTQWRWVPGGQQHRQEKPQHLLEAEEIQGSQAATCHPRGSFYNAESQALPGRLEQGPGISVFAASQTPNQKHCSPFSLQRHGQPASGSQAPSFWFQGHDPLLTLPSSWPAEGPPQPSPGALCPPFPLFPLIIVHPCQARSPHGICPPPLTSPDSAALCPRPAFQLPPWPPPGSPPIC